MFVQYWDWFENVVKYYFDVSFDFLDLFAFLSMIFILFISFWCFQNSIQNLFNFLESIKVLTKGFSCKHSSNKSTTLIFLLNTKSFQTHFNLLLKVGDYDKLIVLSLLFVWVLKTLLKFIIIILFSPNVTAVNDDDENKALREWVIKNVKKFMINFLMTF